VPELNGFWTADGFKPVREVHLGVALSLRSGAQVAPAIQNAADLDIHAMMAALKELVSRARARRLRSSEVDAATATVTSLGDQGVEAVYGVIHPPQVALVGFGKVQPRPWALGDLLGIRPVTTLTLAADHRASDGFTGARLLTAIESHLHEPEGL
jgi:pyruvate dehydrogenase E2 component (dihydrolipoamide acetyltransferase)